MNGIILAAMLTLTGGYNNVGVAGEVVALEAATSNATATVEVQAVSRFTTYTNVTADVVSYETAYALTYTNYDGEASIATNVIGYVDYDYFKTNGVSKIIAGPTRFDMPITNTVVTATIAADTYTATNTIATITTADHFGSVTTNAYIFGGGIYISGAEEGDTIKLIYK